MAKRLTPQQIEFKQNFCSPDSPTFGNAYQSAKRANYSEEYCKNITGQNADWISEIIRDKELLDLAEQNLKTAMSIPITDEKIGDRSLKATVFVAKTLGKHKYSDRQEVTGAEGAPLSILFDNSFNETSSSSTTDNQEQSEV